MAQIPITKAQYNLPPFTIMLINAKDRADLNVAESFLEGPVRKSVQLNSDSRYSYRPWKTIRVRAVVDCGETFYIQGDHRPPRCRRSNMRRRSWRRSLA